MKRTRVLAVILAALAVIGAVTVYATQGSQTDPLITLSYLEKVVQPKLEEKVDEAVAANTEEMETHLDMAVTSYENRVDEKLASAGGVNFVAKDLIRGEKLTPGAGKEVLLVEGEAAAVGSLTDTTAGQTVKEGETLVVGHLYVTLDEAAGLTAGGSAKVMVR